MEKKETCPNPETQIERQGREKLHVGWIGDQLASAKTRSECHCRHGSQRYGTFRSAPWGVFSLSVLQRWKWRCDAEHGRRSGGGCQGIKKYMITCAFLWVGFLVAVDSTMVNYQKYITVMQLALGVTAVNKEHCLPPRKRMW